MKVNFPLDHFVGEKNEEDFWPYPEWKEKNLKYRKSQVKYGEKRKEKIS